MDILIIIRDFFINLIAHLPAGLISFTLRMGLFLWLSIIFLPIAWFNIPSPSIFGQTCITFIILTISLYIPVEKIISIREGLLTFIVILCFFSMIALPNWLPFWLTPKLGNQMRLKKIINCVIWGLFVIQIIVAR